MATEFNCSLSTPQGSLFEGPATSVIAPGLLGQFAVLARHEHMIAVLKPGVLLIRLNEKELYFAIDSGCLEVDTHHNVVILADKALEAKDASDAGQKVSTLAAPAA